MARIRTFLAVEATDEIRGAARRLIQKLSSTAAGVRWVAPENVHLTLKFLGDVEETRIYEVCRETQAAAAESTSFQLNCVGTGAFPSPRRPRTIWMGVRDPEQALAELQRRVDKRLGKLGFPREKRRFHGHLTLGRLRYNRRGGEELTELLEREDGTEFGTLPVDEVVVFSSELTSQGPSYTALGRCQLG